jgi:threonine dehydratase
MAQAPFVSGASPRLRPTTVISSPRLSEAVGCEVTVVTEAFQHTGSFKFRAAWQVASNVPNSGIRTSSSGNFGQAMAYACQLLGKSLGSELAALGEAWDLLVAPIGGGGLKSPPARSRSPRC